MVTEFAFVVVPLAWVEGVAWEATSFRSPLRVLVNVFQDFWYFAANPAVKFLLEHLL